MVAVTDVWRGRSNAIMPRFSQGFRGDYTQSVALSESTGQDEFVKQPPLFGHGSHGAVEGKKKRGWRSLFWIEIPLFLVLGGGLIATELLHKGHGEHEEHGAHEAHEALVMPDRNGLWRPGPKLEDWQASPNLQQQFPDAMQYYRFQALNEPHEAHEHEGEGVSTDGLVRVLLIGGSVAWLAHILAHLISWTLSGRIGYQLGSQAARKKMLDPLNSALKPYGLQVNWDAELAKQSKKKAPSTEAMMETIQGFFAKRGFKVMVDEAGNPDGQPTTVRVEGEGMHLELSDGFIADVNEELLAPMGLKLERRTG